MTEDVNENEGKWAARRGAAALLRLVIFLIPVVLSVLGTAVISKALPAPENTAVLALWWVLLSIAATSILYMTDKAARQLLPLHTLLNLSLIFPDQAPSRFKAALRTSGVRQLERRIAEVKANGLGDSETEAAETLVELVAALGHHDRLTRGHAERVRGYSRMIGEEMGLSDDDLNKLTWAGLMHDVGKLFVPTEILNKPGKLTPEEFEIIKIHPGAGAELVEPLKGWLGEWLNAVGQHHERWDGDGYPNGLAGANISLGARIVSVADTFDVLTSARSYKDPSTAAKARAEIQRCAGSQFDSTVVRAFLNISVGRFRLLMGPLSWLAQAPFIGVPVAPAVGAMAGGLATAIGLLVAPVFDAPTLDRPTAQVFAAPAGDVPREFLPFPTTTSTSTTSTSTTSSSTTSTTLPQVASTSAPPTTTTTVVDFFPNTFETPFVPAPHQPPVVADDYVNGAEDVASTFSPLANDGGGLTVSRVGQPAVGTVTLLLDSTVRFDPPPNWSGKTSFTYDAKDTRGQVSTAKVTIDYRPMPDAPQTQNDWLIRDEDSPPTTIDVTANDSDADLQPLRLTSITRAPSSSPAIGTVSITSGGLVRFAPIADAFGNDQFIYVISDPDGLTASGVLTVTLNPINDPPVARNDSGSMNEDTAKTFAVRSNDFDIDGGALTTTSATSPDGTATTNGTTVRYRPAPDSFGTHRVTYTINDGRGGTASAVLTINVAPVNDPPVARNDTGSMTEDDPARTFDVLANDTDVDGGALSITSASSSSGTATTNGSNVSYRPDPNSNGTQTVSYTISDGRGGTASATLTVYVAAVNDPPTFTGGGNDTVAEDSGPRTRTAWATAMSPGPNDEASQTMTFNVTVSDPSLFSVQPAINATTGNLTYTPALDANGIASITVRLTDSGGATSAPQTANLIITAVNDPPRFNTGSNDTVAEDSGPRTRTGWATSISPGPANESSQTVSFNVTTDNPSLFSTQPAINATTGTLTYTPAANAYGVAVMTISLTDSAGATSAAKTARITVTPVNDPPVARDEAYSMGRGGTLTIAAPGVLANDSDVENQTLTVATTPVTPPTSGSLNLSSNGGFTYTPNPTFVGQDSFRYRISDGTDTATAEVRIFVDSGTISQGWYLGTSGSSSSTWNLVGSPRPAGTPEPDHDLDGDPGLTIKSSNQSLTDPDPRKYQNWTLAPTAPLVLDGPVTLDLWSSTRGFEVGKEMDYSAWLHDCAADGTDCQPITSTLDVNINPWNGSVADWVFKSLPVGVVDHTIVPGRMLRLRLMFEHEDAWIAASGARPSQIVFTMANEAPVANSDSYSVDEDSATTNLAVLANDVDVNLDPTTVRIVGPGPTLGSAVPRPDGTIAYTPAATLYGTDSFAYEVCDTSGLCSNATVTVTVRPVNDAPTFTKGANRTVAAGSGPSTVLGWATGISAGPLNESSQTVSFDVTANFPGLFSVAPTVDSFGTLRFTPGAGGGIATVSVTAVDDGGTANGGQDRSPTQTFTITVTGPTNRPPVAVDDSYSTGQGSTTNLNVKSNDSDPDLDDLSYASYTQPANGTVTNNGNGTLRYTPNLFFWGVDTFFYTITDGRGGFSTARVTVLVNATPVAVSDSYTVGTGNTVLNVTANDFDSDGQPLSIWTVSSGGLQGTVSCGTLTCTYNPQGFKGVTSFFYFLRDPSGASSNWAQVTITAI